MNALNIDQAQLRTDAVNEVCAERKGVTDNIEDFCKRVANRFIEKRLQDFPNLCAEARRVNWLKLKELQAVGNEKGWSEKKSFMFQYVIPRDLYLFMINMVYRGFWDEENRKVWRPFMKGVMRGEDATSLLRKVKVYYGAVSQT